MGKSFASLEVDKCIVSKHLNTIKERIERRKFEFPSSFTDIKAKVVRKDLTEQVFFDETLKPLELIHRSKK